MYDADDDIGTFAVLQEPLSLEPLPFERYASRLGNSADQVIVRILDYIRRGIIRRFAGIIKHDRAGFFCNAMVAFEVSEGACDVAGERISRFPFVTHCYSRKSYPDWPYNLYTMIHARDTTELTRNLDEIKNIVTYNSLTVLKSLKEYKKAQFNLADIRH